MHPTVPTEIPVPSMGAASRIAVVTVVSDVVLDSDATRTPWLAACVSSTRDTINRPTSTTPSVTTQSSGKTTANSTTVEPRS